jgi:hypothetical protein
MRLDTTEDAVVIAWPKSDAQRRVRRGGEVKP